MVHQNQAIIKSTFRRSVHYSTFSFRGGWSTSRSDPYMTFAKSNPTHQSDGGRRLSNTRTFPSPQPPTKTDFDCLSRERLVMQLSAFVGRSFHKMTCVMIKKNRPVSSNSLYLNIQHKLVCYEYDAELIQQN